MGKSVNRVFLVGNVGQDPEISATRKGALIVQISIATSERSRNRDGQWEERAEWHHVVGYRGHAELVRATVKKGMRIFVMGRLRTNHWESDRSQKNYSRTEVVIEEFSILGPDGSVPATLARIDASANHEKPDTETATLSLFSETADVVDVAA